MTTHFSRSRKGPRVPGSAGRQLRAWRQRRGVSQLVLAGDAGISTRHLSFIETGRSLPGRETLLRLSEYLDIPLRDRNILLSAAGYAACFPEYSLDDPALGSARTAIDLVLNGHAPYPACALDRHWNIVAGNNAMQHLLRARDQRLLEPPVNLLRLVSGSEGLAPHVVNLTQWRAHLARRLRRRISAIPDRELLRMLGELEAADAAEPQAAGRDDPRPALDLIVPLMLNTDNGVLRLFSTTTIFGGPMDVTLSEIALECFYPADTETARILVRAGRTSTDATTQN